MDSGSQERRSDGFTAVGDQYANYEVYDNSGGKVGKVDDLFLNEADQPEYLGVKMGFLGMKSTLIPWDIVTPDESSGTLTVATDKDTAKNGPTFSDDHEITPEYENEVRSYYGLTGTSSTESAGSYGGYYSDTETETTTGAATTDATTGAVADDDELRVQRSEEELRAGTREREAGQVNVRKRVRVDRERLEVPVKHEEVSVERVPVNEAVPGAEIGEDEVAIPVTEEEVVVDKRAVVKEEIRVRKDVVQDTEVVEEDVRREEIDIEDATTTRRTDTGV